MHAQALILILRGHQADFIHKRFTLVCKVTIEDLSSLTAVC